jgi:hypothetical protein
MGVCLPPLPPLKGKGIVKHILIVVALVLVTSGCHVIKVEQPITVGVPGTVYQSTSANYSVEVLNNSNQPGDVLVEETLLFEGLESRQVRKVGFDCRGIVMFDGTYRRFRRVTRGTMMMYFVPQDPSYQVVKKSITVSCQNRKRTIPFVITASSLRKIERPTRGRNGGEE